VAFDFGCSDYFLRTNWNYALHIQINFCVIILLARSQYSEGPATGHNGTGFSWFPSVYKQTLSWFPTLPVATTCSSCSPSDLNLLVSYYIFTYVYNNHCHPVTAHLQSKCIKIYNQAVVLGSTLHAVTLFQ